MSKVTIINKKTEVVTVKTGSRGPQGIQGDVGATGGAVLATNMVTNGDFSNGTTGWSTVGASLSVVSNTLIITNLSNQFPRAIQTNIFNNNQTYYVRMRARVTNALATDIFVGHGSTVISRVLTPIINQWYEMSGVVANPVNSSLMIYQSYSSAEVALNKVMEVQYVSAINLTQAFGAGNEPTKEYMDGLLSVFPNSWFAGTREIINIDRMYKEKVNKLMATNLVTNGDFSNGTTGWGADGGSLLVSGGIASVTCNGSLTYGEIIQARTTQTNIGDRIYVKSRSRVTNSNCASINNRIATSGGTIQAGIISNPIINQWYDVSGIGISTPSFTSIFIRVRHNYSTTVLANTSVMETDNIVAINLTQLFGAGNEPTKEQMDYLLSNFPNSWFNGTTELMNYKQLLDYAIDLDNAKANKVQEAWITPTLLNGYVQHDSANAPVRYRKDQFGRVWLRGKVSGGSAGQIVISFPVDYRPISATDDVIHGGASPNRAYITTSGNLVIVGYSTYASFDGISFPTT